MKAYDCWLLRLVIEPWISEVKCEVLALCWLPDVYFCQRMGETGVLKSMFIASDAIVLPLSLPWHITAVRIKEICISHVKNSRIWISLMNNFLDFIQHFVPLPLVCCMRLCSFLHLFVYNNFCLDRCSVCSLGVLGTNTGGSESWNGFEFQ